MKVITVGRISENNNIIVKDDKVSRNHLQIVQDDDGNYAVVDLDSTNGTFVNGQRIRGSVPLRPGDILKIGNTELPWQSYFEKKKKRSEPGAKRGVWGLWIVAGVLLLTAGGIFWYAGSGKMGGRASKKTVQTAVEQSKTGKNSVDLEEQMRQAENEFYKAESEYANAVAQAAKDSAVAAQKRAEADRELANAAKMREKAANSKSTDAENKAKDAEEKARKASKAAQDAEEKASKSETAKVAAETQLKKIKEEFENLKKELEREKKAKEEALKKNKELQKENEKLKAQSKDKVFEFYLKQLKGHEKDFCAQQKWETTTAKSTIQSQYKAASDQQKQNIIDAMEKFVDSLESMPAPVPASSPKKNKEVKLDAANDSTQTPSEK
ncbi:MAG: FHA domain-containing protein [Bacteroidales bacterium]|nr:FHA domain-containing protein [Bacteroidales bacterium]